MSYLSKADKSTYVIYCAGIVFVASRPNDACTVSMSAAPEMWPTPARTEVCRLICVSSVHAIPKKPMETTISEVHSFSPELVHGGYARTKAETSQRLVLDAANDGLNACVVLSSGIISPGNTAGGGIATMLSSFL